MTIRGKNLYLKKKRNNKVIVSTIIIAILVIGISSYSYALWSKSTHQEGYNEVNVSCLDLVVNDNKPINLVNAYQLTDEEALEQVPYSFKITNNCNSDEYVRIQLDMKSSNTLSTSNLRTTLKKDNNYVVWPSSINELTASNETNISGYSNTLSTSNLRIALIDDIKYPNVYNTYVSKLIDTNNININGYTTAKILDELFIDGNTTKEFKLYIWIDEDTPYESINNKTFESKIEITNQDRPYSSRDCDNEELSNIVYCIDSYEDLVTLRNEVNAGDNKLGKYYFLTTDLDLKGRFDSEGNALEGNVSWTPIGDYDNNKPFSGTFDGEGHVISNLYINSILSKQALFSYVENGKINNVGVINSYIFSTGINSASVAGALNYSYMNSVYGNAIVISSRSAGGLSGSIIKSEIKNSYNLGNVTSSNGQFSGGIAGYVSFINSIIKNTYNSGIVSGPGGQAGGIVGGNQGVLEKVYNIGNINGTGSGGGIVGQLYNGSLSYSYNKGIVSNGGGGIVGLISAEHDPSLFNTYYQNLTASYGISRSSNSNYSSGSNEGAEPLPEDKMPKMIDIINDDNAFVQDTYNINNGYPVLKWQLKRYLENSNN